MAGAGCHADQGADLGGGQIQLAAQGSRVARLEVITQCVPDPGLLLGVHLDQVVRVDQLAEVVGPRRHHQQDAGRSQHAAELGPVAWGEDVEDHVRRLVGQGERAPQVGQHRRGAVVGPSGPAQGRLRHVQPEADGRRGTVEHGGQIVAGSGAGVHDQPVGVAGPVGEGRRDEGVVAGAQEGGPVGDHLGGVADVRHPSRGQVGVPLLGHVEAVPVDASQGPVGPHERLTAHRAPQVRQCSVDHWSPASRLG